MVPVLRLFIRLAVLGAALSSLCATSAADDPNITAAIADTVVQIGDWKVSRYVLEKQHAKFRAAAPASVPAETAWLETFLRKQVLTAHLHATGGLEQPEVRATVERMARHMLSQIDGPFYRRLAELTPLDDARFAAMHADSVWVVDALVARFPDRATAGRLLGADFDRQTPEEQHARLAAMKDRDDAVLFEGAQRWPFPPYFEIRDSVSRAPLQTWTQAGPPDGAVFWCWVRSRNALPANNDPATRARFRAFAERLWRQDLQAERRTKLLRAAEFRFSAEVARRVLGHLLATEGKSPAAPATPNPAFSQEILVRYRRGTDAVAVSVAEFLRRREELIVRPVARGVFDLTRLAEDLVLREFDAEEAQALGVTTSAQFVEDRRAFAGAEALALHERDVLRPRFAPGADEIAEIYRHGGERFVRATKVRGRLLVLRSDAAAARWLAAPDRSPPPAESVQSSEPITIARGETLPGLELFSAGIFTGADGRYFGPGQRADGILIFQREAATDAETAPLAEVSAVIREEVLRERLDAYERTRAIELCRQLRVVDHLDLPRLGIRGTPVRPWNE